MTNENDHIWFDEQIAAYLARGLEGDDLARFESHLKSCPDCAAKLETARNEDSQLQDLFRPVSPSASFEDRMIVGLRTSRHRTLRLPAIHPAIKKAALATAAVIVLGGFGYIATEQMGRGHIPVLWSDTRVIGSIAGPGIQATSQPSAWFGFDTNGAVDASKRGPLNHFSSVVRDTRHEFSVNGDVDPGSARKPQTSPEPRFGRDTEELSKQLHEKVQPDYGTERQSGNRQNVFYSNGHTDFQQNPFGGVKTDTAGKDLSSGVEHFKPTAGPVAMGNVSRGVAAQSVSQGQHEATVSLGTNGTVVSGGTLTIHGLGGRQVSDSDKDAVAMGVQNTPADVPQFNIQGTAQTSGRGGGGGGTSGQALFNGPAVAGTPAVQVAEAPTQQPSAPEPAGTTPTATTQSAERKVIRNGQLEFEIDSFDNAALTIAKIVREEGGFLGATNSEKLPNGKVKGTITLRVPPDHLDTLVLKLRALGDLKRQNLTADDVTKAYNDLQSELRAAQAMQERLIDLIKNGKGAIKDLLAAEKELGVWREKIEKVQGEINYYNNLVAMATLNITLLERDIRQAAEVKQSEDVQMGVESDDVEQSSTAAIKAIEDAKGRIIESELKKFEAGQFAAKIVADVAPDQAGPVIDRLKQLGKVARLEIQRKQTAPTDTVKMAGLKVERGDTRLNLSFYNLANVAPRQTVNLNLASDDVEKSFHAILARIEKASGRVVSSNLNRAKPDQTTGVIQFETKSTDAEAVLQDVRAQGEAMKLTVTDNPDTANVTTAKRGFSVQIVSTATAAAREAAIISAAARDVSASYQALLEAAHSGNIRITESQMNQVDPQNMSATMVVELKRDQQAEFEKVLTAQGQILNRNITRSTDNENTLDSKLRWQISLVDADRIPPRQSTAMTIETEDVEQKLAQITAAVEAASGRVADSGAAKDAAGVSTARARIEVPLGKSASLIDTLRQQGKVREIQTSKNMQAPDGPLARATIDLTLTSGRQIVGADSGLWATIRNGLATSVSGLLWSLQLIIIGLCLVAPWVLLIWVGWKLVRRRKQTTPTPAAA
ncbi:MAG TPA: DUF4349 domain-containing protein [Tepidisphaeraceae bacterium]|nr:DUF4349 domain-containing protein [Tepidisphaeraceae bacterium]